MALLQCEMCCGELEISPDKSVGVCKYCGSTFTIPKEIEKKGNLFNRANYLRQNCNFDKAIGVYESILAENCEDADALWGLVLCRYGIEFVEDPKTGSRIPTCHRASRTSILLDPDFKAALNFADAEKAAVYKENATRIDQIQKAILSLSDTQEKYEVFICYKETDENGERTIDSVLAQELYNELKKEKIRTFFARKTLEGKVGSSYEPIIYSALTSANVMIVLGTKPEYFEATWVKNEWSRYLDFMQDSSDKHLIPAYKGMSAYQLPEEFAAIQAVDMSRIGFMQDLCDGVKKLLRKNETEQNNGSTISKESLYSRAMVFLGNREFYKAVDYFEKVLDIDPQYARAYWGQLLASYQCVTNNELINCTADDWTEDARLNNALQFANPEEKAIYEDTLVKRTANFKKLANAALESKDYAKCIGWCDKFIKQNSGDGSVWWIRLLAVHNSCNSNELYQHCLKEVVSILDMPEYKYALEYSIQEESAMYEKTAQKIERAVLEKRRSLVYDDCHAFMCASIESIKRRRQDGVSGQWRNYEAEAAAFATLRSYNGKFCRNNIFAMLIQLMLWGICAFFTAMIAAGGDETTFRTAFLTVFGLAVGIAWIVKLSKYSHKSKRIPYLMKECENIGRRLEGDKENVAYANAREAKAEKLLEEFLADPSIPVEEIEKKRAEFEAIL